MSSSRILVVDDEHYIKNVYLSSLTRRKWKISFCSSVDEALSRADLDEFHLIIADLSSPELGASTLIERIKNKVPETALIILSEQGSAEAARMAQHLGADDYFQKPIANEALDHAIARSLENRRLLQENKILGRHVALYRLGRRLSACSDSRRLAVLALDGLLKITNTQSGVYLYHDLETDIFRPMEWTGIKDSQLKYLSQWLSQQALQKVNANGPLCFTIDLSEKAQKRQKHAPRQWRTALIIGIQQGSQILALAAAFRLPKENGFTKEAQASASFFSQHLNFAILNINSALEANESTYLEQMTGLYNRHYFIQVAEQEIEASQITGRALTLIYLDLDHFKEINDSHGHILGSQVLIEAGKVIKKTVRQVDLVFRLGGDEYAVLLLGVESPKGIKTAERLREKMERHVFQSREGVKLKLNISIGVAAYPEHALSREHLFEKAEAAMILGKKNGRNRVYVASKMDIELESQRL